MNKALPYILICALAASALAADTTTAPALLNARQKAALGYEFCGVTLGMTQLQVRKLLPKVRKMTREEVLSTGRSHNAEFGAERWMAKKGLQGATHAHFDFLDSTLYAMSWLKPGNRKAFGVARGELEETFGKSDRQHGNSHTWILKGIERRIEINFEAMIGIRVNVVDDAKRRELGGRQSGD